MKSCRQKSAAVPVRPPKKKNAGIAERVNDVLIFELEIERDEDLQARALLASFPGYDEDWTASYLAALLEEEFAIELLDEEMAKLETVQDVYNIVRRHLTK